ncbi:hypothetical protein TWF506_007162 [Arthrobotrys conoides]|uniref:Uncharacterized protein n=1 Tax=Arthrobotrys conoides TaxID=74498 RepID=A0AAN8RXT7_9PEZI
MSDWKDIARRLLFLERIEVDGQRYSGSLVAEDSKEERTVFIIKRVGGVGSEVEVIEEKRMKGLADS